MITKNLLNRIFKKLDETILAKFKTKLYTSIVSSYKEGIKQAEITLNLKNNIEPNKKEIDKLEEITGNYIKGATDEIFKKVKVEILSSILNKENRKQTIKRLRNVVNNSSDTMKRFESRLKAIAITEDTRIKNHGAFSTAKKVGAKKKYIQIILDSRTTEISKKFYAKYGSPEKAINIDEEFEITHKGKIYKSLYPPFMPNDRDYVLYAFDEIELKHKYIKRYWKNGRYIYLYYDKKDKKVKVGELKKKDNKKRIKEELEKYDKLEFGREIIRKNKKKFKAGEDSKSLHFKNGNYTNERKAKHKQVLELLKNKKVETEKKLIITAGLPGSGKSSTIEKLSRNLSSFQKINNDDIKEKLDYNGKNYNGFNAMLLHNEARDILKVQLKENFEKGNNIILDNVFKKDTIKILERAKKYGYYIEVLHIDVKKEVALERALQRFKTSRRYVPPMNIANAPDIHVSIMKGKKYIDTLTTFNNDKDVFVIENKSF